MRCSVVVLSTVPFACWVVVVVVLICGSQLGLSAISAAPSTAPAAITPETSGTTTYCARKRFELSATAISVVRLTWAGPRRTRPRPRLIGRRPNRLPDSYSARRAEKSAEPARVQWRRVSACERQLTFGSTEPQASNDGENVLRLVKYPLVLPRLR